MMDKKSCVIGSFLNPDVPTMAKWQYLDKNS
jgi:hypothetical protein